MLDESRISLELWIEKVFKEKEVAKKIAARLLERTWRRDLVNKDKGDDLWMRLSSMDLQEVTESLRGLEEEMAGCLHDGIRAERAVLRGANEPEIHSGNDKFAKVRRWERGEGRTQELTGQREEARRE